MLKFRSITVSSLALVAFLAASTSSEAQIVIEGQYASQNSGTGSVRLRSPGNLTGAGVFRAQETNRSSAGPVEIVETEEPTSIRAGLIADSLAIVFDTLNQAIVAFHNLILVRAGRAPTAAVASISSGSSLDASDNGSTINTGNLNLGGIDLGSLDLGSLDLGALIRKQVDRLNPSRK